MRADRRPDVAALVAGLAIAALGALVLLDGTGALQLRLGVLAPAVCAVLGATLLASGLTRRG
jgi:hypothetical protein